VKHNILRTVNTPAIPSDEIETATALPLPDPNNSLPMMGITFPAGMGKTLDGSETTEGGSDIDGDKSSGWYAE
jgi:hypothetical protein